MNKPRILNITPFDATQDTNIYFTSSSDTRSSNIKIFNNLSGELVYENLESTFYNYQTIPSGTLTNGTYYNVVLTTYTQVGGSGQSATSDTVAFYCFTQPTLTLEVPTTVKSSAYKFRARYEQIEGEKINSAVFTLYDLNKVEIKNSGVIYNPSEPPLILEYTFDGLSDDTTYYIKAECITKNGMIVSTDMVEFITEFERAKTYMQVFSENKCDEGVVYVSHNLKIIDGQSDHEEYIQEGDNIYLNIRDQYYAKWDEGLNVDEDFNIAINVRPSKMGQFCILANDIGKYITFRFARGFDTLNRLRDCVIVENDDETLYIRSNHIDPIGSQSDVWVFLKKLGNTYDLFVQDDYPNEDIITWNDGDNTVKYNDITNIEYLDETSGYENINKSNTVVPINIFPLVDMTITNGKYNNLFISDDESRDETNFRELEWNQYTLFYCDFNNNIQGGGLDINLSDISTIRVKRRKVGVSQWITIIENEVETVEDIYISLNDFTLPLGESCTYAISFLLKDGSETELIIGTDKDTQLDYTTSKFDGVYICDKDKNFKLYNGVVYDGNTANKDIGLLQPIGNQYPVIVDNSRAYYLSGSLSASLYGYTFDDTRVIDRQDVVLQTKDFNDFMSNGNAKILKDWNGNIWLARTNQSVSNSFVSNYGNGITNISWQWVEQGKYDNEEDLRRNNLI